MKVKLLKRCRADMRIIKIGSLYCFQKSDHGWYNVHEGTLAEMLKIMHYQMKRKLINNYELVKHKIVC
jgi:hypothetical protein